MYEPDLARVKRALQDMPTLVLPDTLPAAMTERGYRLQDGVMYWNTLPLSDMSTLGALRLFEVAA